MPGILLKSLGLIIILIAALGLITGKVMAGSRGLKANYYSRQENATAYYMFIVVYFVIGLFILFSIH